MVVGLLVETQYLTKQMEVS